jgi:hypothetical protein
MGKLFGGGGGGGAYDTSRLERAAAEARALQKEVYEQGREDIAPWHQTGAGGIGRLGELLGVSGEETVPGYGQLTERFGMEQFEADPGYAFRQQEAQKALQRAMAAQGVTLGGGGYGEINPQVARALEEQAQGLAAQEYGAAFDRYRTEQQDIFNRLFGVSEAGRGAAGTMIGAGQDYATNVGNIMMGLAGAQTQAAQQQAAARRGRGSMFGTLVGGGLGLALGRSPEAAMTGARIGSTLF